MASPERRNNTGFSRIPSRLVHRARLIRQYRTDATSSRLLPPSPAIPGSGCLRLHPAATTTRRWTVSHLHPKTAAPRGALPLVADLGRDGVEPVPALLGPLIALVGQVVTKQSQRQVVATDRGQRQPVATRGQRDREVLDITRCPLPRMRARELGEPAHQLLPAADRRLPS